jgi:hypothetical protein
MRRTWASSALFFSLLMAMVGCYSTERRVIQPPKNPEVYALPPENDSKWDKPLEYPKGTLNQDSVKLPEKDDGKPAGPGMRGAGGPKMGMGGGGGY